MGIKYTCDRCGNEIPLKHMQTINETDQPIFCKDCALSYAKWLKNGKWGIEDEE